MLLKKCPECKKYTLQETCAKCKTKTKEAHYRFRKRFIHLKKTN
ncbi:MAG: nucleolar RNA-binding Nop10p family protein [Candidatus Pacearchaeota archaeon]